MYNMKALRQLGSVIRELNQTVKSARLWVRINSGLALLVFLAVFLFGLRVLHVP